MKYVFTFLGVLSFSLVGYAHPDFVHSDDEEYYGFLEENPVQSAEFEIDAHKKPANGVTIKSNVAVDSTCAQVGYDVYRKGQHKHYIDYYVERDGDRCRLETEEKKAS